MEEVEVAKKQVDQPSKQEKGHYEKSSDKENRPPKLQFQNYTLLNAPLHKILDYVKVVELLNPLERKELVIKPSNAKKYYKYHKINLITLTNVLL